MFGCTTMYNYTKWKGHLAMRERQNIFMENIAQRRYNIFIMLIRE
ncbi:hypothetical protein SELR_03250 [Selenomonas ruminantium subsp. lactilytica TAM6421]|uniref:Uncharacterized protein n=1 Tax=Selenomonas ruminantium subsp. lactilytica (strain NBRC 103574 / TAM6421) TaxID=927704 RepID=I0GMP6_SELRL|nr:hypothetical protein SELR_03250 [Selenomonas ruminantium subsp. lactilytica TAM6421]